jgi:hypothetical protein
MLWAGGAAPLRTAANTTLVGLMDRPGAVEGSELPPPPPPQAASNNTRPAHRPCSTKEARPTKLPPFFALATDDGNIRRQAFFFFPRFRRRFPKNISTMGEAGQRIPSCRDVMTPSRDAMTQMCHAFCKLEIETSLVKEIRADESPLTQHAGSIAPGATRGLRSDGRESQRRSVAEGDHSDPVAGNLELAVQ